ncbi:MAG: SIR2 family protein [Candidatus Paceibacteria bacterium]
MAIVRWPSHLVQDLARRRAIIVIGAGVSKHSLGADGLTRPPVWKEFLVDAADVLGRTDQTEHIYKAIESGDLLHACEWLKSRFDEDWRNHLRQKFITPRFSAARIHELIAFLDTRVVFTLNFDEIYENKSREINEASQFVKNYYDTDVCEFLRGEARYVVKVHGNLSSTTNLIFTQEEYAAARIKHNLFYSAFDAALLTHTFFFVGCGYGDPDVNLILENQAFVAVPGAINPHYFLSADSMPDDLKSSLRKNRNLKVIGYDRVDENHSGLVNALEDLLNKVVEARSVLVENGNW